MPSRDEYYDPKRASQSNEHWLPWLQRQLLLQDILAYTPEMPKSYDPDWPVWVREFERYDIGPETILVGHSCGAGFLVKYLSLHPELTVGKVVLVAPWMDPDHDETHGFFDDFQIDPQLLARTKGVTIFNSDNDMGNVHKTVAILRQAIPDIGYREFKKHGHFCTGDGHVYAFPELLAAVLDA